MCVLYKKYLTKRLLFDIIKTFMNLGFVFGAIAKENGINVTKEDLDAEYTKIAESYKMDVETVKKALEGRSNELVNNIFMSKIHELLVNNNKFN